MDNDTRLTILHAHLSGVAGYFSTADEYSRLVNPFSNEREIVYIDVDAYLLGSNQYLGVLAHELQHAAHWNADPTEETWLNEGLSELAQELAGFPSPLTPSFINSPNVSLLWWPDEPLATVPHYGAAKLFVAYLIDHYGGRGEIRRLVSLPQDGIKAIDAYLEGLGYAQRFPDVFAKWVAANYLNSGEGQYGYRSTDLRVQANRRMLQAGTIEGTVPQYAAEYIELGMAGDVVISFKGATATPLLPTKPHSGSACWWGNRGDSIDATLTREVDLTSVDKATLSFWVWYQMEESWDYAYVEVSTDQGRSWDILEGPSTVSGNPVGTSFGPGYTGSSNGWIREVIDLSPYAGQPILLRFEYVTDDALNDDGLCVDDIAIPEVGLMDDAEADGTWIAEGFIRTTNAVAQSYVVQVIEVGREPQVRQLNLDARNEGELVIQGLGSLWEKAVVVVAPLAPKTSQPAPYTLMVRAAS